MKEQLLMLELLNLSEAAATGDQAAKKEGQIIENYMIKENILPKAEKGYFETLIKFKEAYFEAIKRNK